MKKWLVFAIAGAALLSLTDRAQMDVARLKPAELIYVRQELDTIYIETDTGDLGQGSSIREAIADLKQTCTGELFLDTADYLVLSGNALPLMTEIADRLRPSTEVCRTDAEIVPQAAAVYLSTHSPGVSLQRLRRQQGEIPELKLCGERYCIEK